MERMTNHERLMAVYKKQLPDIFPVGIYAKMLARGSYERMIRSMGLGLIDYHPITSMLGPACRMDSASVSEIKGADLSVRHAWENGEHLEIRMYETPVGVVSQHVKKDPMYGSDWVVKDYIERPEDYKVVQYLVEKSIIKNNNKGLLQKIKDMGKDGVVLGRVDRSPFQKLLVELANPQMFLMDILMDVKEARELIEAMILKWEEMFEIMGQSSAQVIWQPENLSGDLTSPDLFKKYCMPIYNKLVTSFDRQEKPFWVHADGRMKSLLGDVAKCPFDGCESYSYPEMGNDITFIQARQAWPDKVIVPNFPASLSYESRDTIVAFLTEKLCEAGTDKPYFIQFSENLPPELLAKTILVTLETMNEKAVSKSC